VPQIHELLLSPHAEAAGVQQPPLRGARASPGDAHERHRHPGGHRGLHVPLPGHAGPGRTLVHAEVRGGGAAMETAREQLAPGYDQRQRIRISCARQLPVRSGRLPDDQPGDLCGALLQPVQERVEPGGPPQPEEVEQVLLIACCHIH